MASTICSFVVVIRAASVGYVRTTIRVAQAEGSGNCSASVQVAPVSTARRGAPALEQGEEGRRQMCATRRIVTGGCDLEIGEYFVCPGLPPVPVFRYHWRMARCTAPVNGHRSAAAAAACPACRYRRYGYSSYPSYSSLLPTVPVLLVLVEEHLGRWEQCRPVRR